jgi:chromosome partitioning protein
VGKKKATIITLANQKGGVGKTTSAVNLSYYFSCRGKHVLLIDMDAQGHAAKAFGCNSSNALWNIMAADQEINSVKITARPGLDIIASSKKNESLQTYLTIQYQDRVNFALSAVFSPYIEAEGYDYVFVDTPPSSGVLQTSAVVMSDYIIVPILPKMFALHGLADMISTYATITRMPELSKPPVFFGVLVTQFDRVLKTTKEMLQLAGDMLHNPSLILPPIPIDANVEKGCDVGKTIFEFAPDSPAAIGLDSGGSSHNSKGRLGGYLHIGEIIEAL